jgi:galactose mutarotase-like enzyme
MTAELTLTAASTSVVVAPARGGKVLQIRHEGRPLLAERTSPVPLRASASTSYGDETLDWLSDYDGGWDVLFPNAGDACIVDGIALPFHGEASRARWTVEDAGADSVTMSTPCRLPLVLRRTVRVANGRVFVEEEAVNLTDHDVSVLWGHHPVFAATPGLRIDLPDCVATADADYGPPAADVLPAASGRWPHLAGRQGPVDLSVIPSGDVERYVGLSDLAAPWAAWRDPAAGLGVGLAFDPQVFAHLWLWVECGGRDFPWLGNTRYVGVEPQSWWPGSGLAAAREVGGGVVVPAGGSRTAWVTASVFAADDRPVSGVDRAGTVTFRTSA